MARILIADDDAHTVRIMSLWLTRHGHEIVEAHNGNAAVALLQEQEVDLIISDMNMPGKNGCELLKSVREELGIDVPFVMLSSRCDQRQLRAKLEPLGGHLLPKPFVPSRLVTEIEELLGAAAK